MLLIDLISLEVVLFPYCCSISETGNFKMVKVISVAFGLISGAGNSTNRNYTIFLSIFQIYFIFCMKTLKRF